MAKLTFATPDAWHTVKDFGCATLKFANTDASVATCDISLQGEILTGTYAEILKGAKTAKKADVAIVVFGNAGGENGFIRDLRKIIACPMVGGGAAFADKPGLIPGGGEAAVLLINDERYCFQTQTQCIHEVVEDCTLELADPRTVKTINGTDAKAYLAEKKAAYGLADTDFEHLTLTDMQGINAHLSCVDGVIKSGRDLQQKMQLRYVEHEKVYPRIRAFYDDPQAIIFGCAGLGGLLDRPLQTRNLGLFLFGEVCTVGDHADFGNLMLSKLRILPK